MAFRLLVAGLALAGVFFGISFLARSPTGWIFQEIAFWCVAGGFSAFYGVACFRVWRGDDRTQQERANPDGQARENLNMWLLHMYWHNALGCFVGWVCVRLLWARFAVAKFDPTKVTGFDQLVLAFVAFLGVTGYLPLLVIGLAWAGRQLACRAAEAVLGKRTA